MIFAIATPSRGLIHSRTAEAIGCNLAQAWDKGHLCTGWTFSHDLPIPDAHNYVTQEALECVPAADFIWYVEEDVVPAPDTLLRLLSLMTMPEYAEAGIAIADYPMPGEGRLSGTAHRFGGHEIFYCGMGCTLVRRQVFEALEEPYFRTDRQYMYNGQRAPFTVLTEREAECPYGGQDVAFCIAARNAGFRIAALPEPQVGHAHLIEMGTRDINKGAHTIEVMDKIERYL